MTRVRTRVIHFEEPILHWRAYDSSSRLVGDNVSYGLDSVVKEISDTVTPGYFSKLRNSEFLPINPVSIKTTEHMVLPFGNSSTWSLGAGPTAPVLYSGQYDPRILSYDYAPVYTPPSSDIDAAVIKALSKAKSPEFDVLTFIGEWRETMELVKKQGNRVRSLVNGTALRAFKREVARARRGKRAYNPARAYKDFGSLWLEARFGWRPAISSIESALKALSKNRNLGLTSSSGRVVTDFSGDNLPDHLESYPHAEYVTQHERTGSCTIRAKVYHRSNMSNWGFNPVVTAYELTRFSFVLDYFVNAGKWLTAVTPRVGYNQLGISVSVKIVTHDLYTSKHTGTNGWSTVSTDGLESIRTWHYQRFEYDSIPLPSFQPNLNTAKLVDLFFLALTMQKDVAKVLKL